MNQQHIAYRPDIDGLRALAVISVVIFHFNKDWLPGGFIGVDIFFVISGFLITSIIYKEGSNFSFADFYGRRIRRILPAVSFVTLITLIVGSFLLLPDDVKSLSDSAIWATLAAANIYYWLFLDTSYFASSSDLVPLLHLWSLGIEEQFYMIWPALMIISIRFGGKRTLILISTFITIASFAISEYSLTRDPSFAYYILPSRAGELLIGALIFFFQITRNDLKKITLYIANVVGLILIVYSLFLINEVDGFPGLRAIIPSLGAALLIISGSKQKNQLTKILTNKIALYIGLRSFSLYLWHWPVLAFYRYGYGEPTLIGGFTCLLLILVMTEISFRFVETPFRTKTPIWLITKALPIFVTNAIIISISFMLVKNNGYWPTENGIAYKKILAEHIHNTSSAYNFKFNCQMSDYNSKLWSHDRCISGDISNPTETLLWGDSNAAHYVGYLKSIAEHENFSFRNISHSVCPPFRNIEGLIIPARKESCDNFNESAFEESKKYKTVIIGASWDNYIRLGKERIAETIAELAANGNQVIIALKVPVFPQLDRMCSAKAIRIPGMDCKSIGTILDNGDIEVNLYIKELANKYPNVSTFGIRSQLCDGETCSAYNKDDLLYYDPGHINMIGSQILGHQAVFEKQIPTPILSLRNDPTMDFESPYNSSNN